MSGPSSFESARNRHKLTASYSRTGLPVPLRKDPHGIPPRSSIGHRSFDFAAETYTDALTQLPRPSPGHVASGTSHSRQGLQTSEFAVLRNTPLFASLPVTTQSEVVARLARRRLERGQFLIREGDIGDALHILVDGRVKVSSTSLDGDELIVGFALPGDCVGAVAALDGNPSPITVMAHSMTMLLSLSAEDTRYLALESPRFAFAIVQMLSASLRATSGRLEDAFFYDLDTRMARCLVNLVEHCGVQTRRGVTIDIPLSQSELAAMLGAGRSRINQLLNQYQDDELIEISRRSMTVTDIRGLRQRARLEAPAEWEQAAT